MHYKLLNEVERVVGECCVGPRNDYEQNDVASDIAWQLTDLLESETLISSEDWVLIHATIQSGLALAGAKAMRILGASASFGLVTSGEEQGE